MVLKHSVLLNVNVSTQPNYEGWSAFTTTIDVDVALFVSDTAALRSVTRNAI